MSYKPGKALCEVFEAINSKSAMITRDHEKRIIEAFVAEVNRVAEGNMLKTGKLEGSHHAAIQTILKLYDVPPAEGSPKR